MQNSNYKDLTLDIAEMFVSIQGEGAHIGLPTFFIRLAGCNLRCKWCDTKYAQKKLDNNLSLQEIISNWINKGKLKLVQITGGEPLLQKNIYKLIDFFIKERIKILLETNGSISLKKVPKEVVKIMDIKTPSSGMTEWMNFKNLAFLDNKDEVKFIIADKNDYLWTKEILKKYHLNIYTNVVLSPAFGYIDPKELASWIIEDLLPVRFQIQLHKILWGDRPGV